MAKALMIQGTMSNAGKSLITAGLCRIFHQDGYRVAPFKSQNMALNSYITEDGLEMGRAQVVQAQAAGLEPRVEMNPILLKPTSDSGSQVIVNGEVLGNMPAAEYFRYKKKLIPQIMKAYERLAAENDIIVIEGAGSPAEINLKEDDIVNMGMARLADANVILVGDIDRGGVFASLYGTIALMEEEERARIKATLINKFRGDVMILKPGLAMLEELTGVPVAGVVPYAQLDIEDEDSLSQRMEEGPRGQGADIAVIRLPRISNFTDFNALERTTGLSVRYVKSVRELGQPDMILLPGTKNTMGDLKWLRTSGLEAAIKRQSAGGVPVAGICGGFQMLGKTLSDPMHVEEGGAMQGMELLPVDTVFTGEKVRTRAKGTAGECGGFFACLAGTALEGYEIHMGASQRTGGAAFSRICAGGPEKEDGAVAGDVMGTYVHGVFDSPAVCERLAQALLRRKGLDETAAARPEDIGAYRDRQYDKLAELIRNHVDMNLIYQIALGEERA